MEEFQTEKGGRVSKEPPSGSCEARNSKDYRCQAVVLHFRHSQCLAD
jgi:hypothetical protein